MAEFEWQPADVRELVHRDRMRVLSANAPYVFGAALFAAWLRTSVPPLACVFLGMCTAWALSLLLLLRTIGKNWRSYVSAQFRPLQVTFRDDGLTWEGPHGSRVLRWDGLSVRQLGTTWVLLIGGRELAYLPGRALSTDEAEQLQRRATPR
jgi:hypothetical protein